MTPLEFPECRHRDAGTIPGVAACRSPRLVGDGPVTPEMCSSCFCRDHPAVETTSHSTPAPGRKPAPADLGPSTGLRRMLELLDGPPLDWPAGWAGWDVTREAHRVAFDREAAAPSPYPGGFSGRGVVFCAGGWRFFASLYVSIRVLRHVGCRLPVQVWYLGDRGEFDPRMEAILRPWRVEWVDADALARGRNIPWRMPGGWEAKPFAMLHCPFREVLLLDADNYPVCDPEYLFDCAPYREFGAVFWPDLAGNVLEPAQWERWGLEYRHEPAFESGQVLVDKSKCWHALRLTVWLNDHSDYTYQVLYGDKDTFHVAWAKAGLAYGMAPPVSWSVHTFLQHDFEGRVVFQHRARDKFRLGHPSFMTDQTFRAPTRNLDLAHEEFCFRCLGEVETAFRRSEHLEYWLLPFLPAGGDTFLDVGANRGHYSLELASCFRRVLAFEPNPDLCGGLRASLPPNVAVCPFGLWDEDGDRDFTVYEHSEHLTAARGEWLYRGPVLAQWRLSCRRLDGMMGEIPGRVEFIKVDTEAAECEVIRGAEKVIRRDRPLLLVEIHTAANRAWLTEVLSAWGYRLQFVTHPGYPPDSPLHSDHSWVIGRPEGWAE